MKTASMPRPAGATPDPPLLLPRSGRRSTPAGDALTGGRWTSCARPVRSSPPSCAWEAREAGTAGHGCGICGGSSTRWAAASDHAGGAGTPCASFPATPSTSGALRRSSRNDCCGWRPKCGRPEGVGCSSSWSLWKRDRHASCRQRCGTRSASRVCSTGIRSGRSTN